MKERESGCFGDDDCACVRVCFLRFLVCVLSANSRLTFYQMTTDCTNVRAP